MAKQSVAHAFSVIPQGGTADDIVALLRQFVKKTKQVQITYGGNVYWAGDAHFVGPVGREVFTATVFKLRTSDLPSVIDGVGAKPLVLDSGSNLGEAMCFAYDSPKQLAIVQNVSYGPRYSIIRTFLDDIGLQHYVNIDPILKKDMLDRLEHTKVFRTMRYAVKRPADGGAMRAAGVPMAAAIDAMDAVRAVTARVELSMANDKGSLDLDAVKRCVINVLKIEETDLTSLKLKVREEENATTTILDMLGGRIEYPLELKSVGREWDREDCRRQLAKILREFDPGTSEKSPTPKRR